MKLIDLQERFPGVDGEDEPLTGPYVLIERNVGGSEPSFWATNHESIEAAVNYNENQEYAEDWDRVVCIHVPSGVEHTP